MRQATAIDADRDFAKAQYESIVANAKAAVAWTIAKAKTLAQAAATGIATAAQWLWNVAMDANPIALIIIGIAALVAAIIWIATKTTWFQTMGRDHDRLLCHLELHQGPLETDPRHPARPHRRGCLPDRQVLEADSRWCPSGRLVHP